MKKLWILICLLLFTALLLSGCGGPKATGDDQIFQDFKALGLEAKHGVTYQSLEVLKRMTNEDAKTDKVWVWVAGSSADVELERGYELTYRLYNDGWKLEDYSSYSAPDRTSRLSPRSGVDRSTADSYIKNKYGNGTFVSQDIDLEKGRCTFLYDIKDEYPYMTHTNTVELSYTFNISNDWKWPASPVKRDVSERTDWNIKGTWTYSYHDPAAFGAPATNVTAKITVDSYDGNQWSGSYSIQYDQYEHFDKSESGTFSTTKNEYVHTIAKYITGDAKAGFKFDKNAGVLCVHPHGGNSGSKMTKK